MSQKRSALGRGLGALISTPPREAEAPAPLVWEKEWSIQKPDAVFYFERDLATGEQIPEEGWSVPREGTVDYQHFIVETNFTEDKWIQEMEIRPGASDVVHHVVVKSTKPVLPSANRLSTSPGV